MENKIEEPKKLSMFKKILIVIAFLIMIIFCYSRYWIHKFITIKEYPIVVESLPSYFNGLKIVHFSDIHFGKTINENEIKKMVKEINLTNPDIVIFSGDLLDSSIQLSDKNIDFLKEELGKIKAKYKKYAIKGDSDYLNIEAYQDIISTAGFKILDNQNELLFYEGNAPIQIAGISSIKKEEINLSQTFKTDVNNIAYKILIAHEPIVINNLNNAEANLILSGHSFGGYIIFPKIGGLLKKENTEEFQNGFYQKNDISMYVSTGIGTEDLSFRFHNPPSINLYRFYNYKDQKKKKKSRFSKNGIFLN